MKPVKKQKQKVLAAFVVIDRVKDQKEQYMGQALI